MNSWSAKCAIPLSHFTPWIGIGASKFYDWKQRFGKVNEHNAWAPRDHWLTDDEKERICAFARRNPLEGVRRQARAATSTRPVMDFAAVRDAIDSATVLELIGFEARSPRGGQQRGPCPLHGSTSGTSRCFSANLTQQMFQCFQCSRSGNALDLWAAATARTPYDAAVDLCERLRIRLPVQNPGNREEEPVAQPLETCTMTR